MLYYKLMMKQTLLVIVILGAAVCRKGVPKDAILASKATVTDAISLGIEINGELQKEKIVIGLFGNDVPKTAENFRRICKGDFIDEEDRQLRYVGSKFHRIFQGFSIQGGDCLNKNGGGSASIYQGTFEDENFKIKHEVGCVSMANKGVDTNGCQFFIPVGDIGNMDGQHVVFGRVLRGMSVVQKINEYGTKNGVVETPIVIVSCQPEAIVKTDL